jgi:hypothetical protein
MNINYELGKLEYTLESIICENIRVVPGIEGTKDHKLEGINDAVEDIIVLMKKVLNHMNVDLLPEEVHFIKHCLLMYLGIHDTRIDGCRLIGITNAIKSIGDFIYFYEYVKDGNHLSLNKEREVQF